MANKNVMISSMRVVNYYARVFGDTDSGWVGDLIKSIGYGLGEIGLTLPLVTKCKEVEVEDYKAKPPCNAEYVNAVFIDGCRIPKIKPTTGKPQNIAGENNTPTRYWINGPYFQFTFEKGTVEFHYDMFEVDDKGFPLIPNSDLLIKALAWHFMCERLTAGNRHPTIDVQTAYTMWERLQARAANDVNFPDAHDDMERFHNMFTSYIPTLGLHGRSFVDVAYTEDIDSNLDDFTGVAINQ